MIEEFGAWLCGKSGRSRPWLIAGERADAESLAAPRKEGFAILAVGRAAPLFASDAAYVVDVETMRQDGDAVAAQAGFVVMPREPHENGWATGKTLANHAAELPALKRLAEAGRLLSFDLWTGNGASTDAVQGDFVGEEAPLRLLVSGGVRMARHLGMRGRESPSAGLESAPRLAERIGGGLAALRRTSGISYGPYGFPVPARIFVGSDAEQMLGVKVLQYSIDKHATMDAVVEPLEWQHMPVPKDPKNRSKTGFSFCRFDIPRLCGFSGRGAYVDADMQVFADITDLWTLPMHDADLLYALAPPSRGRAPQTSVMLINCEALRWDVREIVGGLDEARYSYKELMSELCVVPAGRAKPLLPYWWNSLETYEPGRTSLLHYTNMATQPWISHENDNGAVWYACAAEAIDSGAVSVAEVENAIERGHVSPEIFDWIGRPAKTRFADRSGMWVAPFHRFTKPTKPEGAVQPTPDGRLVGWAWDPAKPDAPIDIGIFDGSDLVMRVTCDAYGAFLERHGKGNGRHGFDVEVPSAPNGSARTHFNVRTIDKQIALKGSPLELSTDCGEMDVRRAPN